MPHYLLLLLLLLSSIVVIVVATLSQKSNESDPVYRRPTGRMRNETISPSKLDAIHKVPPHLAPANADRKSIIGMAYLLPLING